MSNFIALFTSPEMQKILREYVQNIKSNEHIGSPFVSTKIYHLCNILKDMLNNGESWNYNCQHSISKSGNKFATELNKCEVFGLEDNVDIKYAIALEFLMEYYMRSNENLHQELESARLFAIEEFESFSEIAQVKIKAVILDNPVNVIRDLINNKNFKLIQDHINSLTHHEEREKKWAQEIKEKEDAVNRLKSDLNKYEQAFNFVGLYKGFDDLSIIKENEKRKALFLLIILAIMAFVPILSEIAYIRLYDKDIDSIKQHLLIIAIPSISFVILSVYYFRVVLFNYKRICSQILQIDLRKTLCRFIQSYSAYSSEMKKNDKNSLDKFENIIFSSIISDEGDIPSVYDGLEQIAKIIKCAK